MENRPELIIITEHELIGSDVRSAISALKGSPEVVVIDSIPDPATDTYTIEVHNTDWPGVPTAIFNKQKGQKPGDHHKQKRGKRRRVW